MAVTCPLSVGHPYTLLVLPGQGGDHGKLKGSSPTYRLQVLQPIVTQSFS